MNEYIFYTSEGYTYPPREDIEIENCQVLGRANGKNVQEARNNLEKECKWIKECGFDMEKVISKQILTDENKQDIQEIIEYLWKDEQRHFQEYGRPKDHIYHTLKRLRKLVG